MESKRILISMLLIAAFAVTACNETKKRAEKISRGSPGGKAQTQEYKDSYEFILNGCSTEKKTFIASSKEEANRQMCNALQDNSLNNNCALDLRKDHFSKKCSGVWTPVNATDENESGESLDTELVAALNGSLSDEAQMSEGLSEVTESIAEQILKDFVDCGFDYRGPICRDGKTELIAAESDISELRVSADIQSPYTAMLFLKFGFDEDRRARKVVVSLRNEEPKENESLKDYAAREGATIVLGEVLIAESKLDVALARLETPENIHQLYSATQVYMSALKEALEEDKEGMAATVLELISAQKEFILNEQDKGMQEAMIELLMQSESTADLALNISEELKTQQETEETP